jgi:hypothetical protein
MSPVPETLWREVAADLRPVRPLPAPALRTLEAAVWAIAVLLLVLLLVPVRRDAAALGWLLIWGASAAEGLAGLLLIGLALREAVPASGLGPGRAALALLAGAAIETTIGLQTWLAAPPSATAAHHSGLVCFSAQGGLGFTGLALAFWLVVRALPVRPPWAGALAGMGAGLVADGIWHLVCPRSDLAHVLVVHGGATVALTAAGWLLGWLWEARQARRYARGHAASPQLHLQ